MLMPDRLPDHAATRKNHALFEDFARTLLEEEIVSSRGRVCAPDKERLD